MSNIILIGMPSSGKSTIGVVLAKTCGLKFLDVDLVIQEQKEKLLQEIINQEGLESFLKAEEEAILSLNDKNSVIATGGSAVYSHKGMEHLKTMGKIVYLELELEEIKQRLHNITTRGIAIKPNRSIDDVYLERIPLYEKYADYIIDCNNKTLEEIIEKLIAL